MRTLDSRGLALLVVLGATVVLARTIPSWALTFTVNSPADEVDAAPGDGICATASGSCTLRAAIQEANALEAAQEIVLPAGTYTLTILGQGEEAAATGDLDITGDLTITGAGTSTTVIDGNALDRVIHVHSGAVVTISDVTIQNGEDGEQFAGAGVANAGTLSLVRSAVANNHGTGVYSGGGGGIFNTGTLSLESSTVNHNTAACQAGGICNLSGTVTLKNTTVSNNTETYCGGGGISNLCGSVTVIGSVIRANNTGASGGGIFNYPWLYPCPVTLTVIDSTVDSNLANNRGNGGGGIHNSGQMTITGSSVSNNQSWIGGGIMVGASLSTVRSAATRPSPEAGSLVRAT